MADDGRLIVKRPERLDVDPLLERQRRRTPEIAPRELESATGRACGPIAERRPPVGYNPRGPSQKRYEMAQAKNCLLYTSDDDVTCCLVS